MFRVRGQRKSLQSYGPYQRKGLKTLRNKLRHWSFPLDPNLDPTWPLFFNLDFGGAIIKKYFLLVSPKLYNKQYHLAFCLQPPFKNTVPGKYYSVLNLLRGSGWVESTEWTPVGWSLFERQRSRQTHVFAQHCFEFQKEKLNLCLWTILSGKNKH